MFHLSYTAPAEVKGTIRVQKRTWSLGVITDIEGNRWDIHGIIGDYVQACPIEGLHPYYSDTSGTSYGGVIEQTWNPYKIEVVGETCDDSDKA